MTAATCFIEGPENRVKSQTSSQAWKAWNLLWSFETAADVHVHLMQTEKVLSRNLKSKLRSRVSIKG